MAESDASELGVEEYKEQLELMGIRTDGCMTKQDCVVRLLEVKAAIEGAFNARKDAAGAAPKGPMVDVTEPGVPMGEGARHVLTKTIDEIVDVLGRMGFAVADGPELEDEWHNFNALNIPESHPARGPADNFFLGGEVAGKLLLRTQTSTVQIRAMEAMKPPLKICAIGRVYRPDAPDATHFPMFHQMEGLWVDEHVTMAQLKSVLKLFATSYLGGDVKVRFRPSFFPFTEPSVEVDYWWNDQWIEFGGAGMVDPNVFRAVNIDPERWSGFAFGLGVERLCMRRFGITDIRDLYRSDVRFLRQFAT